MRATTGDQFAKHARQVALELFGEPNKQLSTRTELRFGRHGSVSVDLAAGRFFDHEAGEGGGVLWAVERQTGQRVSGGGAVQWLRANGFEIEDDRSSADHGNRQPDAQGGPRFDEAGNFLPNRVPDHGRLFRAYDYVNAEGALVYQVCRYEWEVAPEVNPKGREKTFVQRRPDKAKRNGWAYSVRGITWLPYRLPELIDDLAQGRTVFLVEGEKKVDMLRDIGIPATCNHGGAGKFPEDLAPWFKDADVVIMPDNDEAGRKHARIVGKRLDGTAASIRILDIPGLPDKGGVDDWLPAGGTAEQLYDLASRAPAYEAEPFRTAFGAVPWLDLKKPGSKHEYLVKGVFTKGEQSMLLGESQSGKSFLAIDIALAVATGRDWFGRRVARGGVIYQAGESAVGVRRKRIPAYAQHHGLENTPLPFVLLEGRLDLFTSDEPAERFIEECKHWAGTFDCPLELIVIDTFNKAVPGANENDGKDMRCVLDRCDRIRRETKAHVMLVHHLNASGGKARGHTSLFADVENVVTVRRILEEIEGRGANNKQTFLRDGNGRLVREWQVSKNKDGEDDTSVRFVLPALQIGMDEEGDPVTSCIVEPADARARRQSGAQPAQASGINLGGTNAAVLRVIYDEVGRHGRPAPREMGLPSGIAVVARHQVAKALKSVLDADDLAPAVGPNEDPDAAAQRRKQAAAERSRRAREYLFSRGIIGLTREWIWLTGKEVQGFGRAPRADQDWGEAQAPQEPSMFAGQASAEDEAMLAVFEGGAI